SDAELRLFLKNNNYILQVFFHKSLHKFSRKLFRNQYSSNIHILPHGTNVQEQLLKSEILITDYSSVAWDFLFLNKPVVFYQFDNNLFYDHHKPYISIPRELFGSFTRNYQE